MKLPNVTPQYFLAKVVTTKGKHWLLTIDYFIQADNGKVTGIK